MHLRSYCGAGEACCRPFKWTLLRACCALKQMKQMKLVLKQMKQVRDEVSGTLLRQDVLILKKRGVV